MTLEELGNVIVGNSTWDAVIRTLLHIQVVEEEISKAKSRYPKKRTELDAAFLMCAPVGGGSCLPESWQRHHAREILARVINGESLARPTLVEMAIALSQASLREPVREDFAEYILARLTKEGLLDVGSDTMSRDKQDFVAAKLDEMFLVLDEIKNRDKAYAESLKRYKGQSNQ